MPYCRKCGTELTGDAAFCPNCGTAVEPSFQPSGELVITGWGVRFVAWLIDSIILGLITAPISLLTSWATWTRFPMMPFAMDWVPFSSIGWGNIINFLYWTVMEGTSGQSIGKMVMRIKVTRLNGEPLDFAHAAIESLGKAFLLPIDLIIGWILYTRKRQRLFNYISETIVIRVTR